MSLRDRLLGLKRTVVVPIEGLGEVHLRRLSAAQTLELQSQKPEGDDPILMGQFMAQVIILSVLEDDGITLAFADDDTSLILDWPAPVLTSLVEAIMEVSGFGMDAEEEVEKNSQPRKSASSTDSP